MREVLDHLSNFPAIADHLETLRREMNFMGHESPSASLVREWHPYGYSASRYLPLSLRPILEGLVINAGVAVGWHRAPSAIALSPAMGHGDNRLLMGHLIHVTKEYDGLSWAVDTLDIHTIGHLAACALTSVNFAPRLDLIAAVPSSRGTNLLPFLIAKDISFLTRIRHAPSDTLFFARLVEPIKETNDYWQKRAMLHMSIKGEGSILLGRHVLLVDDVCRSGATFHEAARACIQAGAASVAVLAVSKTFKFQRIPDPESTQIRHSALTQYPDGPLGS
jgi:hypothetical protein